MVALVLVGLGLLAYFAFLGFHYLDVSMQSSASKEKIGELQDAFLEALPDIDGMRSQQESRARAVEDLRATFDHGDVSELMAIVSNMAREASVGLVSMVVGGSQAETVGGIEYRLQPMTITLVGSSEEMTGFFSALHRELPIFSVADLSISSPGRGSTGQARLLLYTLPGTSETDRVT